MKMMRNNIRKGIELLSLFFILNISLISFAAEPDCAEGEIKKDDLIYQIQSDFKHMRKADVNYSYMLSQVDCNYVIFENEVTENDKIKRHKATIYKFDMSGKFLSVKRSS